MGRKPGAGRRAPRRIERTIEPEYLEPPPGMSRGARLKWIETAPIVAKQVRLETVRDFLLAYCNAWTKYAKADKALDKSPYDKNILRVWRSTYELVDRAARHLGLSPLSARHVMNQQKADRALEKQSGTWRDRVESSDSSSGS
jgi:hypothetical protein